MTRDAIADATIWTHTIHGRARGAGERCVIVPLRGGRIVGHPGPRNCLVLAERSGLIVRPFRGLRKITQK